uniref:Uncharacterized protein n=1 Tax=Lutzomyia longipalpis TaxID=7200 RepID=A0A1B0CRU4_LUTLO
MGKVAFLLPNQNQMVYRKMTSTNNNMRECAKRFFMNTYTNPNTMVDAGKQTMLKALMIQCEKYPKIMEPDVSEEIRRNLINEILQKFRYFAAACEDVHEMHVTVIDMLFHMNLKKYLTHQHDVSMRQMVEFTLDKVKNTTDIPTLYMMNMLLYQLAEINSFATEKIKSVMKEWAGRFIERRDESVLEHLSSAVYVHNTNEVLPQKKRTDLLRITKSIIDEVDSHNNRIIHHIILIHADLLCTNWGQPGADRAELKKVAKELIDFHILPFMTFDFRDDQIFNLKILQAFSLILAHFVKHKVREMNTMWGEMQVTFYKFIQQAIFCPSRNTMMRRMTRALRFVEQS